MADQPTEARLALYRKFSTEHLQTLLRSDLDGPPLDEATVDSILTVLTVAANCRLLRSFIPFIPRKPKKN